MVKAGRVAKAVKAKAVKAKAGKAKAGRVKGVKVARGAAVPGSRVRNLDKVPVHAIAAAAPLRWRA